MKPGPETDSPGRPRRERLLALFLLLAHLLGFASWHPPRPEGRRFLRRSGAAWRRPGVASVGSCCWRP